MVQQKKPSPDAAKAKEHATQAEQLIGNSGDATTASVHASLAVYYQLRAAETGPQANAMEMLARQLSQQQ